MSGFLGCTGATCVAFSPPLRNLWRCNGAKCFSTLRPITILSRLKRPERNKSDLGAPANPFSSVIWKNAPVNGIRDCFITLLPVIVMFGGDLLPMGEMLRLFILFFGRLYVDIYRDKDTQIKSFTSSFFFSWGLATDLTTLFYFSGDELS